MARAVVLLGLWIGTTGLALECRYDGKDFRVMTRMQLFTHSVAQGYQDYFLACGDGVAALYDGDDFTVFDARRRSFEWKAAANDFRLARAAARREVAALYDGESAHVYDASRGAFASHSAYRGYRFSQVAAADRLAGFYDGQNWIVYDAARGDFVSEPARGRHSDTRLEASESLLVFYDGDHLFVYDARRGASIKQAVALTRFPTVVVGSRAALFYDGKQVVGYCSVTRAFTAVPAEFDPFSRGFLEKATGKLVLVVKGKRHELDPRTCRLSH